MYFPVTPDRSGEILAAGQMQAAQTNAQMMSQLGSDIGGALASIGGMYAENKGLEAKAKGYDQVGKILGDSMFKDNPAVGAYLNEIRGMKNPMERISGYEALFGMTGPLSNAMMAQGRIDQAPALQAQRTTDQRNLMYEREQLARERQMMNTPQTPAPITVPTGMRRFNTGGI